MSSTDRVMAGTAKYRWGGMRSKYRARPTFVGGRRFPSKKEARRYTELLLLEQANEIRALECQQPFSLDINGQHICKYVADFTYLERQGEEWIPVIEDVKGARSGLPWQLFQCKWKLLQALYPTYHYRIT